MGVNIVEFTIRSFLALSKATLDRRDRLSSLTLIFECVCVCVCVCVCANL